MLAARFHTNRTMHISLPWRWLLVTVAVLHLCVTSVRGDPWSRSLPNGTQEGFPVAVEGLVIAQGKCGHLYAFDVVQGTPAWTIGPLGDLLYPFAIGVHDPTFLEHPRMAIFQGPSHTYGVDTATGDIVWTFRNLSSPVYLPVLSADKSTVLVGQRVNTTAPRCLAGLDRRFGSVVWQNCDHQLFAMTLTSGSPLPVVITEKTFFGCFQSQQDPNLSIVLEVQLNDPAFPPHIFDFYPMTALFTPRIGFVTRETDDDDSSGSDAEPSQSGRPIRVSFAVSNWDYHTGAYVGPTHVVSVIAQSGMIEWRTVLTSRAGSPINFFVREKPRPHEIITSDGTSFLVALRSDTGRIVWNVTLNASATSNGATLPLGPVAHVLETDEHVIYSQPVHATSSHPASAKVGADVHALMPPASRHAHHTRADEGADDTGSSGPLTPSDHIVVQNLYTGIVEGEFFAFDTVCANLICHHNVLYIPNNDTITVVNITTMAMKTFYYTHSPVYRLREETNVERLIFGTQYSIYCFPLM